MSGFYMIELRPARHPAQEASDPQEWQQWVGKGCRTFDVQKARRFVLQRDAEAVATRFDYAKIHWVEAGSHMVKPRVRAIMVAFAELPTEFDENVKQRIREVLAADDIIDERCD